MRSYATLSCVYCKNDRTTSAGKFLQLTARSSTHLVTGLCYLRIEMVNVVNAAVNLGSELINIPNVPAVNTALLLEQLLAGQQQMHHQM